MTKIEQLSLPGFERLSKIERRRKDREERGIPWTADPSWVRCPQCEGVHPVEAIIWWGEPVCTKCFTIESVQPAVDVPSPRPIPFPDYTRGAVLPYPGLRIRDVIKEVVACIWKHRILVVIVGVLLLVR